MNNHTDKPSKVTDLDCEHQWVSNSGAGGEPDFRMNRQMSAVALMHVKCYVCDDRTWFTKQQWEALSYSSTESHDAKPSESPTPRTDDFLCVVSGAKGGPHYGMLDVEEPWPQYKGLADFARQLERELAEELEKKREVFIALHDRALKAEADLASAIANHAADLSARSATAPRWIPLEERKPAPGQKVLRFNHPILVPDGIDVGEVICADGKPWALPGTTHWMQLPSAPVDSGGAK